ncbi:hypothetical protein BN931_1273 [Bifidobacterium animalis subsp. lactis CECT 8145]|nr:hypothetical protein M8PIadj_0339 [Bifidobacterium animalis]CDL72051.1 hypothetical protein BN931_1273 [Bifidobacterium animalis subsp. lactis CECT 8145]
MPELCRSSGLFVFGSYPAIRKWVRGLPDCRGMLGAHAEDDVAACDIA